MPDRILLCRLCALFWANPSCQPDNLDVLRRKGACALGGDCIVDCMVVSCCLKSD